MFWGLFSCGAGMVPMLKKKSLSPILWQGLRAGRGGMDAPLTPTQPHCPAGLADRDP